MVKVFVIGCGRIAGEIYTNAFNTHGGAYDALDGAEIVACIDTNYDKAILYSQKYNCKPEKDLEMSLEKYRPDIVSVCTPDQTHFRLTEQLLLSDYAPKLIFLEKPVCQSGYELKRLIDLSEQKNVEVVVNFTRRFDQHCQQLKIRIKTGKYGVLRNAYATYYSGWQHNGVHHVDALSFLFDDDIEIVSINNAMNSKYKSDPTLGLLAKFTHKPGKIYFKTFNEEDYQLFELELQFDKSRVRLEDFGDRVIVEHHHINIIGENVIRLESNDLVDKTETAMQVAVKLICKFVEDGDSKILDGYRISDSVRTMNTIWQGKKMYEKNRLK